MRNSTKESVDDTTDHPLHSLVRQFRTEKVGVVPVAILCQVAADASRSVESISQIQSTAPSQTDNSLWLTLRQPATTAEM